MSVEKPSDLPRWATEEVAEIDEPSSAEKDSGFVPGTPALSAQVNWLLNKLYQWMQYLDDPASLTIGGEDVATVDALDGKQPLDAGLTALAGLGATAGLIEKTGADTYTERAIGVGTSSSIPTLADADARYGAASHSHAQADITNLTTDLAAKAPLASPALTGTPTSPTATAGTNSTQLATTAFVASAIADLVGSAPGVLNTLGEIADAINDDANLYTTLTSALAAKAPLASPGLTGTPTAPTATGGTNTTQLATTAFVQSAIAGIGALSDGDKGDITLSALGTTWTIDADAVSNAKLANMATGTIKARITGSTGDPEDATAAQLRALLGGNLLNVVMLTSGTTYTPTTGTTRIYLEMVGGGGGGGGTTRSAANMAAGGGGASGSWAGKFFTGLSGTYAYAIGAGGSGGAATGASGNAGGSTTFTGPGSVTVTAYGGGGGTGMTLGTSLLFARGGTPGGVPANADFNSDGHPGACGIRLSGTMIASGAGGSSPFGAGGHGWTGSSLQPSGYGYGSGGAGGCGWGSSYPGGSGTSGCIRVWEFS